jgi:hypothetical protein
MKLLYRASTHLPLLCGRVDHLPACTATRTPGIIQVMSNEIFGEIAKLKTPHDMWIYLRTSYRRVIQPFPMSLRFDHLCASNNESVRQRYRCRNLYSAFETEWNRIAHLSQSSAAGSSTYRKIVKDLFTCQEVKRDFLLAWFAESHDNVVENLSSKDHLTYHEAKERILNLPSNHRSPSGASSKNSKPQHEANAVSSSNGKKDKKKKKGSSSSSNSGGKECNWCRKHSPGHCVRSYMDTV